jgi:4-diphosphocytidyl-2-C-methyl-D-erythritol kinase
VGTKTGFSSAVAALPVENLVSPISIFAPAKVNLFLAITGRRRDGFHDLVSVAAPIDFGDTLDVSPSSEFSLECDGSDVPLDDTNLVLKAARLFAEKTGWRGGARFILKKRIPVGAGLGGGSSDAIATLRALNHLADASHRLESDALAALAAQLGSDCPLFLHQGPVIMRGRGDAITSLPASARQRVRGRRLLLFKPGFGVATAWAYSQLATSAPTHYVSHVNAEQRLAAWLADSTAPLEELLFNNMEPAVFAKFIALPVLLAQLQSRFGVQPHMSGSGSACYTLLQTDTAVGPLIAMIRDAWGESAFVREALLT